MMQLETLKDGDRLVINGNEYIFHKLVEIDEVEYMRCTKVETDVPMLVRVKE